MSGDILTLVSVQHMQGNVATVFPHVPARVWTSPGAVVWVAGSGSTGSTGPAVWSAFPGPPGWENITLDLRYRAFHRCARIPNSVNQVTFHAWHKDIVYALTAPPAWTTAHTCTAQRTDASARDGGDHTGLYPVHSLDGDRLYFCGFYRTTGDTVGVVRYDTLTNTWMSRDTGLSSATLPFSVCVPWQGKLAHTGQSGLFLYDPQLDELRTYGGGTNYKDWLTVCRGRLFLVLRFSPNLYVYEFVAGGFYLHGQVTGSTENTTDEGGYSIHQFTDGVFYVAYYTTTGGTGWRYEKVAVGSSEVGAQDVVLSDLTSPVIPNLAYGVGAQAGDLRWPGATESFDRQQIFSSLDNSEWPRGAFGTAGGVFAAVHMQCPPVLGTTKFQGGFHNWIWNGEGSQFTLGQFPDEWCDHTGHYSHPVSLYGRGSVDFNGTGAWIEHAEPYSDGTVARGLLIQFRLHEPTGGAKDWQLQHGQPPAELVGPGITASSLSLGDGIDPGGTAVLNTAGPGGDTLDELVGAFFTGGFPQALLNHNAITAGPGFAVGDTITATAGAGAGTVGTVLAVRPGPINRLGVQVTAGTSFQNGDTIEATAGTGLGTIAQLNANQDTDPLYQVVWDLESDGIPAWVWVELSTVTIPTGTARPPGNTGTFVSGPTQVMLTADNTAANEASSEVGEPVVLTDAVPNQVSGEVSEPVALSDAPPNQVSSEVSEPLAESDNIPNVASGVSERPTTEGGGLVGWQEDGVEQALRPEVNHLLSGHGVSFFLDTRLPDGPEIGIDLDSLFELGRTSFDATVVGVGGAQQILDLDAAGVDSAMVVLVVARAVDVSGVSVQPSFSVGTNPGLPPAYDNQVPTTVLTLTATDQAEDLLPSTPTKVARSGEVISAQLDAQATATTYVVELIVYGRQQAAS